MAQEFTFGYCGKVLEDGSMDARELASALINMAGLLERSNDILNRDQARIVVNIKADFKKGSFIINLNVDLIKHLSDLVTSPYDAVAILVLLGLIAGHPTSRKIIVGLIQFIKKLKGSKITKVEEINKDTVKIEAQNSSGNIFNVNVNKNTYVLANDLNLRSFLSGLLKPTETEGIDAFNTYQDGKIFETVKKEERDYFTYKAEFPEPTPEIEETFSSMFHLRNISFEKENKWKLTDDSGTVVSATIHDKRFLEGIERGMRFGKHDIIKVKLRIKESRLADGKIKKECDIIEVLEHIPAPPTPQQINLLGEKIKEE